MPAALDQERQQQPTPARRAWMLAPARDRPVTGALRRRLELPDHVGYISCSASPASRRSSACERRQLRAAPPATICPSTTATPSGFFRYTSFRVTGAVTPLGPGRPRELPGVPGYIGSQRTRVPAGVYVRATRECESQGRPASTPRASHEQVPGQQLIPTREDDDPVWQRGRRPLASPARRLPRRFSRRLVGAITMPTRDS